MITKKQRSKLIKYINQQIDAAIAVSWNGSGDAESIEETEQNLKDARKRLNGFIAEITESETDSSPSETPRIYRPPS